MIFVEKHAEERRLISPVIDEFFNLALRNQIHSSDLFLAVNLGYYEKRLENNDLGLCKYVLGLPGEPGLEYMAAYDFIDTYRKENLTSRAEFLKYRNSVTDVNEKTELLKDELNTIQIEQLIYLKFWESNFIIRLFYQLTRLINGECYDWDFDLIKKSRKNILINQVRNRIESFHKPFAELLDGCYNSQVRNAIAHSMFFTIGGTISFTNYKHNHADDLQTMTFDVWGEYIHKTLVLFDELIRARQAVDKYYSDLAVRNNNRLEFLLKTKSHNEARTIEHFPNELNRWGNIQCKI